MRIGEPLAGDMVTLRTLVDENVFDPPRPELAAAPPRIRAPDARARSVLGYLSTNCGSCHNQESSIANLGLLLKAKVVPSHDSHVGAPAGFGAQGFSRLVGNVDLVNEDLVSFEATRWVAPYEQPFEIDSHIRVSLWPKHVDQVASRTLAVRRIEGGPRSVTSVGIQPFVMRRNHRAAQCYAPRPGRFRRSCPGR
jgi:hypothetical protein